MKQLILAATVFLSLAETPAHAADWVQISKGNGVSMDADVTTVVRSGGIVSVWVRTQIDKPRIIGGATIGKMISRWQIRCADRKMAIGMTVFYDPSGNVAHTEPEGNLVFQDIVPDSAADVVASPVCR